MVLFPITKKVLFFSCQPTPFNCKLRCCLFFKNINQVHFMQAMLTKVAFEKSSSERSKDLQSHNHFQMPALSLHRAQVLLTAQALVMVLTSSDLRALRVEGALRAPEVTWKNMPGSEVLKPRIGFCTDGPVAQTFSSGTEAVHQHDKSDIGSRAQSQLSSSRDHYVCEKDMVPVLLPWSQEDIGPALACLSSEGLHIPSGMRDESRGSSGIDRSPKETVHRVSLHLLRSARMFQRSWRNHTMSDDLVEQTARKAMLDFGMPAKQVQWPCLALVMLERQRIVGCCVEK
jgi:hypothetical protein